MRICLAFLALLAATACSPRPSREDQAIIDLVEKRVTLPKGAGKLSCYRRYYTVLRGKQIADELGAQVSDKPVLLGRYVLGKNPRVIWKASTKEMPIVFDGGCEILHVMYFPDHPELPVAGCGLTFAGTSPEAIDPPVSADCKRPGAFDLPDK